MININKISIDEISNLSDQVVIDSKGVIPEKLIMLNSRLEYADLLISMSIDNSILSNKTHITGLDALELLPNVQQLMINVVLIEQSNNIEVFRTLLKLKKISLLGYFKNNISLEPISHLTEIEKFVFENGLSSKQQSIIESFGNLSILSVADLNLQTFPIRESLKELRIFRKLQSPLEMPRIFPGLSSINLENCKDISDFSFIAKFQNLERLTFRHMKQLEKFPAIHKQAKMKTICLINISNLSDLDFLWQVEDLTEFMATEIKTLKVDDFCGLKKFKSLKTVYITFKSVKENKKAIEFARENNWKYRQPGL